MSAPRFICTCIARSGVSRWAAPSRWLGTDAVLVQAAERGQAEDLVAAAVGEEGPAHPVNPWSPPSSATRSSPGRSMRW